MEKDVQEKLKEDLGRFYKQALENAEKGEPDKKAAKELNRSLNETLESWGLVCKVSVGGKNTADEQGIAFVRKDTLGKEYVNGEAPTPTRGIYLWFCYDKSVESEKERLYLEFGYPRKKDYVPCEAFERLEDDGKLNRDEWKGEYKAYPDFENHKGKILEDFLIFVSYYKSFDDHDFKLNIMNIINLNNNCCGLEIPLQDSRVKFKNYKLPYNELTKEDFKEFTEDMYIAWRVGIYDVTKCISECCQKGIFEQDYINETRDYLKQYDNPHNHEYASIRILIADTREMQTSNEANYFFSTPYNCDREKPHLALSNAEHSQPFIKFPPLFWIELQPKGKGFEKYMCFSVSILKSKDNNEALLNQNINTQYAILALDENYGYIPMETYKFFGALNGNRKIRQFMLSTLNNT